MTTILKGIAVRSGSTVVHKLRNDGTALIGKDNSVVTLKGSVMLDGVNHNSVSGQENDSLSDILNAMAAERSSLESGLAAEIARATAAEQVNATAITAEESRAQAAESTNATAISDEQARAEAAEGALTTDLATEASTARAAEGANATAISTEETRALAAEGVNTAAITAEETRATAAEGVLTTNLAAEATTARAAEQANATAISAEATRALAAEGVNATAIAAEQTRAEAAELALTNDLATETGRVDAILSASTADADSFAEIVTMINSVDTENDQDFADYVASNDAALATEASTARAAEQANTAAITAENTRATAAEAALQADVDQNEADADQAIADLQADVDQNEADADQAIADLQSDVDGNEADADAAIAAEQTRAEAAEAALQTDVDQNESDFDTALAALQSDVDGNEADADAAISAEQTRAEAAEVALQADVDQNESDFDTALAALQSDVDGNEADFDTAVSAEETRALAAEVALQADVDQNESDFDSALAALQSDVDQNEADADAAISAEETRATAAELALTNDLATETARVDAILAASDADKDSFAEIVTMINSVDATNDQDFADYVASNDAALASETSTARAAEQANAAAITAEATRATAAEGVNATAVAAEETRALAAEGVLETGINDEATARTNADAILQANINAESAAREQFDLDLADQTQAFEPAGDKMSLPTLMTVGSLESSGVVVIADEADMQVYTNATDLANGDFDGMMVYYTGEGESMFPMSNKYYSCENGVWHPWFFTPGTQAAAAPAVNYLNVVMQPDAYASEIGVSVDGNVSVAAGSLPDGDTTPFTVQLADSAVAQTISITDGYGDGGVVSIEFQTTGGTVLHTLDPAPSYTTGPYDIVVLWDGQELTVNGTLVYRDLSATGYTVLATTDQWVAGDGTTLSVDGVDQMSTIGASQTDYSLSVTYNSTQGYTLFAATDPGYGDGGVSVKFMHEGSAAFTWGNTNWQASSGLPVPATIKFVPETNGIDFKIYDGSVDHTAPGAAHLASTLFTDLNLNTINDPDEVADYLTAQAAGNTETFEITVVREFYPYAANGGTIPANTINNSIGKITTVGEIGSISNGAFETVDHGGVTTWDGTYTLHPLALGDGSTPMSLGNFEIAHGADKAMIVKLEGQSLNYVPVTMTVTDSNGVPVQINVDAATSSTGGTYKIEAMPDGSCKVSRATSLIPLTWFQDYPLATDVDHDSDGVTEDQGDVAPTNANVIFDQTREMRFAVYGWAGRAFEWNFTSEAPNGFIQSANASLTSGPGTYSYMPFSGTALRAGVPTNGQPSWSDSNGDGNVDAGNQSGTGGYNYLHFNLPVDGTVHRMHMITPETQYCGLHYGVNQDGTYANISSLELLATNAGFGVGAEFKLTGDVLEYRLAPCLGDGSVDEASWSAWTALDSDADGQLDNVDQYPYESDFAFLPASTTIEFDATAGTEITTQLFERVNGTELLGDLTITGGADAAKFTVVNNNLAFVDVNDMVVGQSFSVDVVMTSTATPAINMAQSLTISLFDPNILVSFEVEALDTYGDGWNGITLTIIDGNGGTTDPYTLTVTANPGPSSEITTISLPPALGALFSAGGQLYWELANGQYYSELRMKAVYDMQDGTFFDIFTGASVPDLGTASYLDGFTGATSGQIYTPFSPTITLNGGASVTTVLGQAYSEQGATAADSDGTDISANITINGTVDTNTPGTYALLYEVYNAGGGYAQATRIVDVIVPAMEVSFDSTASTLPMVNTTRTGADGTAQSWTYYIGGIAGDQIDFNAAAVTTSRPYTNIEFAMWRGYFGQGYGTAGWTDQNGQYSSTFVTLPSTWTIPAWDNSLDNHESDAREHGRAHIGTIYVRITDEYGTQTEHMLLDENTASNYKLSFIEYEDELAWRMGQTRVAAEQWNIYAQSTATSWFLNNTITGTNIAVDFAPGGSPFDGQVQEAGQPLQTFDIAYSLIAGETYTFNGFDSSQYEMLDASSNIVDMTPYNFVQAMSYYSSYPSYNTDYLYEPQVLAGGTFTIPAFDVNTHGDYRDISLNMGITSNNGGGAAGPQFQYAVIRLYKDLAAFNARDVDQDGADVTTDADDSDPNVQ
jgi:hypothetical protein